MTMLQTLYKTVLTSETCSCFNSSRGNKFRTNDKPAYKSKLEIQSPFYVCISC